MSSQKYTVFDGRLLHLANTEQTYYSIPANDGFHIRQQSPFAFPIFFAFFSSQCLPCFCVTDALVQSQPHVNICARLFGTPDAQAFSDTTCTPVMEH